VWPWARREREIRQDGPMLFPLPAVNFGSDETVVTDPYLLGQDPTIPMTRMGTEHQYPANPQHPQSSTQIDVPPPSLMNAPGFWPQDQTLDQGNVDNLNFRIETKQFFVCAYGTCNKRYARLPDLRRHHRGAHQGNHQFKCRASGCTRAIRGFARRDKRDSHEKSMHGRCG
jgi:hypothetical protein